ncbi:hypothetical protein CYMTET_40316, partial [Cymbomonas tetramitiformis]
MRNRRVYTPLGEPSEPEQDRLHLGIVIAVFILLASLLTLGVVMVATHSLWGADDNDSTTYVAEYDVHFTGEFYDRYRNDKDFRTSFLTQFKDQSLVYATSLATDARAAHVTSVRKGSVQVEAYMHFQIRAHAERVMGRILEEAHLAFPEFTRDNRTYGTITTLRATVDGVAVSGPPTPYSLPPGPNLAPEPPGITHSDTWVYYPSCERFGICDGYYENHRYEWLNSPELWRAACPYAWAINPKDAYAWKPRVYVSTCGLATSFEENGTWQVCSSSQEIYDWLNDPAHNDAAYCRSYCDATDCMYPKYAEKSCDCSAVPVASNCPDARGACCTPANETAVRCFCVGNEDYRTVNKAGIAGSATNNAAVTSNDAYYTCSEKAHDG